MKGWIESRAGPGTDMKYNASLVIRCAVDPTIPCGYLYLSVRIAETLAIGNNWVDISMPDIEKQHWPEVCWQVLGLHGLSRLSQR
jgi:hypothetical protein